jgi:hypothetical protein
VRPVCSHQNRPLSNKKSGGTSLMTINYRRPAQFFGMYGACYYNQGAPTEL